jgi:uncharacterized protein (TIRG00374 family)
MKKIDLKKIGKFLPIIGLVIFAYVIYQIGLDKIGYAFTQIPIHIFILACLPFFIRLILTVYKWQYLAKKQKMYLDLKFLSKVAFISNFYGNIIPGGFGWHIKILYIRQKTKASLEKCLTFSLIEGTTGFMMGLFLGCIGAFVLIDYYPGLFSILILLLIIYIIIFVVFMKKSQGGKIFNLIIKIIIPKRFKEKLDKSVDSLYEDIPRIRDTIIPSIIDIIVWIVLGFQVYIIAMAFSINIPFHIFTLVYIISVLSIGLIPVSVGGLGIREATFVFLMRPLGVDPGVAFVISLTGFIVNMLIPTIIGMFFAISERKLKLE